MRGRAGGLGGPAEQEGLRRMNATHMGALFKELLVHPEIIGVYEARD